MLKSFFSFAILSMLIIGSSCNSSKHSKIKRLPGTWQATPIVIDGKNNDWVSPYPEYDEKAMLGYTVSNDKYNLYITVETGDPATQLKILRNGLTVWIDRKGEKEEVTAINFPIPAKSERSNNQNENDRPTGGQMQQGHGVGQQNDDRQRLALEDKVRKAFLEATEFSLQGFKSCNLQFPLLEKDTCGIIVRMDIDPDNEMVWEAVVPLRSFYFKPEISRSDKGRAISVCFETEGLKRPAGQGGGNRGSGVGMQPTVGFGGMGGMGMGMRMGSPNRGYRGGNSQNNNNIMESLYKNTKTWKTFGLAYQE